MSAADTGTDRGSAVASTRPGVLPLALVFLAVSAVAGWLVMHDGGSVMPGFAGGPVAMLAAYLACRRIGPRIIVPRPVRGFWRLVSYSVVCVGAGAIGSFFFSNNDPGLAPSVAVPYLLGVFMLVLAFLRLPVARRSALGWAQLVLDGATVAVAGTLIYSYVVLDLAPEGISALTRNGAAAVGVGALISLVLIGGAAVSPASAVAPGSLRILMVAPVVAIAATVLLIAGGYTGRLIISVLGVPVIGTAVVLAAYRQDLDLRRPAPPVAIHGGRGSYRVLPLAAVIATTAMVITVSARQLGWHQRIVIIGAVLIAAFVVVRQLLGLRANERMLVSIRCQQAELEHLAIHDLLTQLPNRDRFTAVLAERLVEHRSAGVLLVDMDDFKLVNETMGHAVGDQLLVEVAQRLRQQSAAGQLPARLGGDEFAVLLDADDPAEVEQAAARILTALAVPFREGEHQLLVHASIGVALARPGDTADEVLRNADIAMYAAKADGKASWARFEPQMRSEVVNHARLGSELHHAIRHGELFLVYQPVFDLVSGRMSGAEALVRWRHPVRGVVPPVDFIGVAERSGLIVPLGSWVLREACGQLAGWRAEYGAAAITSINVNVAARQLREPGFVDEVAAVLSDTGLIPANLILEVTESSVIDGRRVRDTLQALHELGVRLALDDFGTGQSSLSLLRAFPVDVLKLDKSFVDGICDGEDRGRLAVAAAVAQLAEYLNLSAVAEGIETAAQLERLREMGYRLGQGYFMARPLPPADLAELMVRAASPVTAA